MEPLSAIQHVRILLIRHGLSEKQADAFLEALQIEFERGSLKDHEGRHAFYRHRFNELKNLDERGPSAANNKNELHIIIEAITLGVAGNIAYDVLNSEAGLVNDLLCTKNNSAEGRLDLAKSSPPPKQHTEQTIQSSVNLANVLSDLKKLSAFRPNSARSYLPLRPEDLPVLMLI